jgi:hypothetical protein
VDVKAPELIEGEEEEGDEDPELQHKPQRTELQQHDGRNQLDEQQVGRRKVTRLCWQHGPLLLLLTGLLGELA